ncbi:hypothetical protein Sjap_021887 [Stephania japonica]|uniref:Uncharacterized protein n=1 Tax=Stephania japonica TaxID=461633 RepID=A0AAP0HUI9_9MAGN
MAPQEALKHGLPSSPCTLREWGSSCSPTPPHTSLTSGDVREALRLANQGPVSPGKPPKAELGHGRVALDHPSLPLPYFGTSLGPAAVTVGLSLPSSTAPPLFWGFPPFFIKKHKGR